MASAIYLASRSPRRRELLRQIGVAHEILLLRADPKRSIDADETPHTNEIPRGYALRVARAKAEVGARVTSQRAAFLRRPVLAADTTIELDGVIVGKPANTEDAVTILTRLSNRSHTVITAVALALGDRLETALSESQVTFGAMTDAQIRRYAATGEPMDKAGAYAVQGRAAAFITRIEGSYSGIMGLPLAETAALLARFGMHID